GHYLAVLLPYICIPAPPPPTPTPNASGYIPRQPDESECEGAGIWPTYIYVIDLTTNKAQHIPDYYSHYQLYADNIFSNIKIIGWFDNDRFGVTSGRGDMMTATKDGSSFIPRRWPGQGPSN